MNKKSAFTLAEVLVAMGIIGIIVTFGLRAAIQNDKAIRHVYSNTYYVLDTALYNAVNFSIVGVNDPFADGIVNGNSDGGGIENDEGTRRLCVALTQYINTVESNPCAASANNGTHVARLVSGHRLISDVANDDEFTDANVQFTATNGVRFFFSRRMPYANNYNNGDTKFFIIYADINGDKFPNSLEYRAEADDNSRNRSIDPDIFAFAALENGRVVPLGPPEFDGRFMLTRISFFNNENNREQTDLHYSRLSQPYYLSKAEAWGYYTNVNGAPLDTDIIEDNPYSFNGYVKSKINANTRIYAFVQDFFNANGTVRTVRARLRSESPLEGGYNCIFRDDEECDVIIDKYVY